jgi:lipoprotein signal peptidase
VVAEKKMADILETLSPTAQPFSRYSGYYGPCIGLQVMKVGFLFVYFIMLSKQSKLHMAKEK